MSQLWKGGKMVLMGLSRSTARLLRHAFALIISMTAMGGFAVALSGFHGATGARNYLYGSPSGSLSGSPFSGSSLPYGSTQALTWPWLVFGMPVLFSLPLAIVFEWLESRRLVKAWTAPLLLIPPVAVIWAFAWGLDGQFEGAVSVLKSLPAGLFCAGAFTTYWLPLWLVRLRLRRMRRSAA